MIGDRVPRLPECESASLGERKYVRVVYDAKRGKYRVEITRLDREVDTFIEAYERVMDLQAEEMWG